ncbi:MAG TPA: DUF1963 domain-containing protein [Ktedonobacterales bacterium]|nr:DUF1963 domain-containing protein [Ktedonobacterales bacterium]
MNETSLQQALTHQLQRLARTCLRLRLTPGEHSLREPESGFGGRPWWPVGETWPLCDTCGERLVFVCQMRLDGGGHWRPGDYDLCLVFFCRECDQRDDAAVIERPGRDGCRLRLLRLQDQPLAPLELPAALAVQGGLPSFRVSGTPALDVPAWQDVADEFTAVAPHALDDLHVGYHLAELEVLRHQESEAQHQLGGYPHWLGASYWPECRWCSGQMYLLAQFVAGKTLALPWGRERRAYLFCCAGPCDPEALTLVLQA